MIGQIFHVLNRGELKKILFFTLTEIILDLFVAYIVLLTKMELCVYMGNRKNYFKNPPPQKDWLIFSSGHYCLIIIICFLKRSCEDGGVVEFTKRIGNGFTKYVNIKNDRSSYLFQNKAKIIL